MPIGQFEVRQMDFIQLPPMNGLKYVLGTVRRFSHYTSVFPFRQATASSVANVLCAPTWGTPLKLHSDGGTHSTSQVLWQVCAILPAFQHFHCAFLSPWFNTLKALLEDSVGSICRGTPNTLAESIAVGPSIVEIHLLWTLSFEEGQRMSDAPWLLLLLSPN